MSFFFLSRCVRVCLETFNPFFLFSPFLKKIQIVAGTVMWLKEWFECDDVPERTGGKNKNKIWKVEIPEMKVNADHPCVSRKHGHFSFRYRRYYAMMMMVLQDNTKEMGGGEGKRRSDAEFEIGECWEKPTRETYCCRWYMIHDGILNTKIE